jgi:hypothetical protein
MQRILRIFRVIGINIVVFAILLELTSVAVYLIQTGEFFYVRQVPGNPGDETANITQRSGGLSQQLHPYFGFVDRQGYSVQLNGASYLSNNFGFASPRDYPFKRENKNQFIIGIFGGSVAQLLSVFEIENQVLTNKLKQFPYFDNKQIIVLPFAVGSYKQPQQLLILNYFLSTGQDLDMVINLDGFNEAALSYLNNKHGFDISMPNYLMIKPLVDLANNDLSQDELSLTLEIAQDKNSLKAASARLDNSKLATAYVVAWLQQRYFANKINNEVQKLEAQKGAVGRDKKSLIEINQIAEPLDDTIVLEKIASMWADSSLMMKNTLDNKGVLYFHFLQANQYYPTGRNFSEEEKIVAFSQGSPYEEGVRKGYPLLLSKIDTMKRSGINVFSLVNEFDDTKSSVYVDNCCHYNKLGNEKTLNYISTAILESLSRDRRFVSYVH